MHEITHDTIETSDTNDTDTAVEGHWERERPDGQATAAGRGLSLATTRNEGESGIYAINT